MEGYTLILIWSKINATAEPPARVGEALSLWKLILLQDRTLIDQLKSITYQSTRSGTTKATLPGPAPARSCSTRLATARYFPFSEIPLNFIHFLSIALRRYSWLT